jgi:hypothetical protein
VRRLVDQVQVKLAVKPPEDAVGQLQNVEVLDMRVRNQLTQGRLNGLGGAEVAGPYGSGQDQDARR